ncbi:hypothetical protein [Ureibacillus acetophenoni]
MADLIQPTSGMIRISVQRQRKRGWRKSKVSFFKTLFCMTGALLLQGHLQWSQRSY